MSIPLLNLNIVQHDSIKFRQLWNEYVVAYFNNTDGPVSQEEALTYIVSEYIKKSDNETKLLPAPDSNLLLELIEKLLFTRLADVNIGAQLRTIYDHSEETLELNTRISKLIIHELKNEDIATFFESNTSNPTFCLKLFANELPNLLYLSSTIAKLAPITFKYIQQHIFTFDFMDRYMKAIESTSQRSSMLKSEVRSLSLLYILNIERLVDSLDNKQELNSIFETKQAQFEALSSACAIITWFKTHISPSKPGVVDTLPETIDKQATRINNVFKTYFPTEYRKYEQLRELSLLGLDISPTFMRYAIQSTDSNDDDTDIEFN